MLKYNKSLDNNTNLENLATYYDGIDLEKGFDLSTMKQKKGQSKRVNMQIPFDTYLIAIKLAGLTGTGYQNTLKMAIAIGLEQLSLSAGLRKQQ